MILFDLNSFETAWYQLGPSRWQGPKTRARRTHSQTTLVLLFVCVRKYRTSSTTSVGIPAQPVVQIANIYTKEKGRVAFTNGGVFSS